MALSKKGKRKIVVQDQVFYWYVSQGEIHVISNNKDLIFGYHYQKEKSLRPLTIEKAKNREALLAANLTISQLSETITPKNVGELIAKVLKIK